MTVTVIAFHPLPELAPLAGVAAFQPTPVSHSEFSDVFPVAQSASQPTPVSQLVVEEGVPGVQF